MEAKLRMYLAELFGTFVLVLFAAGTVCAGYLPSERATGVTRAFFGTVGGTTVAVALAAGCVLSAALSATFYVSKGCLNPAITVVLWVLKRLDTGLAAGLIGMQVLGALLAGLALRTLFQEDILVVARMGTPHLTGALLGAEGGVTLAGIATGVVLELVFTAVLTVAVFATLIDPRAPRVGGVVAGMAQIAIVLFGYHLTGGCANPARWVGPAVWEANLDQLKVMRPLADHLVYWAGPILGALAGGLFYSAVILPPEKKR
jgi:glycerol uptake facilitator-like aquaporin